GDFAFSAESGTVLMYELNWYDSGQLVPDQVTPASDELPLVDSGTGVAGISTSYSRGDHIHPQQLTCDSDIIATKFIMTDRTNNDILLGNGDTTTLDSKLSRILIRNFSYIFGIYKIGNGKYNQNSGN
ncbi:MAG: hypothetical protein EZS28_009976, partial [Streblomastix strix]